MVCVLIAFALFLSVENEPIMVRGTGVYSSMEECKADVVKFKEVAIKQHPDAAIFGNCIALEKKVKA
jgi:hypothetical protein